MPRKQGSKRADLHPDCTRVRDERDLLAAFALHILRTFPASVRGAAIKHGLMERRRHDPVEWLRRPAGRCPDVAEHQEPTP